MPPDADPKSKSDPQAGVDVDKAKMAKAAQGEQPKLTVPEGHRPEEFYNDEQLAIYHQQQLDALADDHPGKAKAKRAAARARIAAAVTAAVDPDLTD